ncbi:hypothetical protein DVJ77_16065 [Dyella tabacisoli]|uniref:Uncharacterized protein n=1 Tax=Dyella tabacisoli TaxID=2282381 RepID=A0A369UKX5_9GAMM|nr:hypothetical protein DVJ77_16065 [Dyella tabacisoli]
MRKTESSSVAIAANQRSPWRRWLLLLAFVLMGVGVVCVESGGRIAGMGALCAAVGMFFWIGYVMNPREYVRAVDRRYKREFTAAMTAYVLMMLFVWPLAAQTQLLWVKALIALLPVVPIALVIRAMVRFVLGSDELQRRLHLEALALATGVIGLLSMALGFQIAAKVIALDGTILFWVYPGLCVVYGTAHCWAERRYRAE